MTKKIFALVMVIGVLGGILGGCSQPTEGEGTTATTATATGTTATGTTAGTKSDTE